MSELTQVGVSTVELEMLVPRVTTCRDGIDKLAFFRQLLFERFESAVDVSHVTMHVRLHVLRCLRRESLQNGMFAA